MLSKTHRGAITAMLCLLLGSACSTSRLTPWRDDTPSPEVNLSFILERNLIRLNSARIDGRPGRFYLASAHARTVIDPQFAAGATGQTYRLNLNERESLPLDAVLIDLKSVGDALIGANTWGRRGISIDYQAGLLTYLKDGIRPADMLVYSYSAEPAIPIAVDGRQVQAIVDTSVPDTLVLPRGQRPAGRARAVVSVGNSTFTDLDIALDDVEQPRIGNRLLAKFLVTIDYGKHQVGLWRDPRIPLE